MLENRRILLISDQHFPYNHPDIIPFLTALKTKYRPDRVINLGDELDYHAISFHTSDPNLLSPSDELQTGIHRMKPLFKLFPVMDILESNHGSLVYRKGNFCGLPRHVFKSYREVIGAPKTWNWHRDLTLKMSNGRYVFLCHGMSADVLRHSQMIGMSVVTGHFHEKFEIRYWTTTVGTNWGMICGCLIDDSSLAYSYNKLNTKRPMIGTGIILDGIPKLLPMSLNENGRWDKTVP